MLHGITQTQWTRQRISRIMWRSVGLLQPCLDLVLLTYGADKNKVEVAIDG